MTNATPDPDVLGIARQFAGASIAMPKLMQAVVTAEGNIIRAAQCSVPDVETRGDALRILARSIDHHAVDWIMANHAAEFIAYFGAHWAPVGVANDPTGLNANWIANVRALWGGSTV